MKKIKKIIKRANKLQVISLIGMTITYLIFYLGFDKNIINLFWAFVGLQIGGMVMFTDKWSKEGTTRYKKLDKDYNKNLTRKTSDSLLFMLVAYTIIVCGTFVMLSFVSSFASDDTWYFGILGMTVVIDLTMLYWVDKTSQQVRMIEKSKNK